MCFIWMIYDDSFYVSMTLLAFDVVVHSMQMYTHKHVCQLSHVHKIDHGSNWPSCCIQTVHRQSIIFRENN